MLFFLCVFFFNLLLTYIDVPPEYKLEIRTNIRSPLVSRQCGPLVPQPAACAPAHAESRAPAVSASGSSETHIMHLIHLLLPRG